MKIAIILSLLILAGCSSNNHEDKEKELLEKELELTKKELELSKKEDSLATPVKSGNARISEVESFVFSTDMLSNPKNVEIQGKQYTLKKRKSVIESEDPPYESQTTFIFSSSEIPNLTIESEVVSYLMRDLNNDGKEEFIACTMSNGTWATIEIYSLINRKSWKKPIESFMWWTDQEGCDAKMYWTQSKNQMRITTTNSANENFDCNAESKVNWK